MEAPLRRGCSGQASFQLVLAPRGGQGEQGHVRGWASVLPRKMDASSGGLRGLGRGSSGHGGVEQGRKRCLRDSWGQKDAPVTSAVGKLSPTVQACMSSNARPLHTWMSGWDHRPRRAPPVSRAAGAGLWAPASLLEQAGTGPLPAQTHLGADSGSQGPQASTGLPPPRPRFPLEGGQARGRRAGQATPVPGEHSLASSGPAGTRKDPSSGTQAHGQATPVLLRGQGRDRASSCDLGWGAPSACRTRPVSPA